MAYFGLKWHPLFLFLFEKKVKKFKTTILFGVLNFTQKIAANSSYPILAHLIRWKIKFFIKKMYQRIEGEIAFSFLKSFSIIGK